MRVTFALPLAIVLLAGKTIAAPPYPAKDSFIVHEWGTFLSVQGTDGVSVGGVVESEEALPDFVLWRSDKRAWNRAFMRQKMETPVTYFYTDKPREVKVRVDMPRGILTHWFPAVFSLGPGKSPESTPASGGTFLDWGRFQLVPDGRLKGGGVEGSLLRKVKPGEPWRFARETDSALVRIHAGDLTNLSRHEHEKFLFYRGLGTFELPLAVESEGIGAGTRLNLRNRSPHTLNGLFAVEVEKDEIRFAALGTLPGEATRNLVPDRALGRALPLSEGTAAVKKALVETLFAAGLFEKEAQAMVNTWERSYFRTRGLRILYILPASVVDKEIPLHIEPAPDSLVRVMVGRVELLTPAAEAEIESSVAALDSPEAKVREAAQEDLARYGRLLEPALRRVVTATKHPEVARRASAVLKDLASTP